MGEIAESKRLAFSNHGIYSLLPTAVDYLRECSGVICALTSLHISNLLPTFEAAVRFHREVQQVVHRDFSDSVDTRDAVRW